MLATTRTDAHGAFSFWVPREATVLYAMAEVDLEGLRAWVAKDAFGTEPYRISEEIEPGSTDLSLAIVAEDRDAQGSAGAFHIVDTTLRGLQAVRTWTERVLPPVFVYWGRGVTREWSYYRGERPAGSGQFALELLGGEPNHQQTTDTDEHDESIILHELGHFVMDRLSTDSSAGGNHPRGFLIDPGLAWEEGRATWFSCAVLGLPRYVDTIGIEPSGSTRIDHDIEQGEVGPRGIGSETTVAEVLWDLSDGASEDGSSLPDTDADGIALGPRVLLRAMMALRDLPGAYPYLSSFLGGLVASGALDVMRFKEALAKTGQPASIAEDMHAATWPIDLAFGTAAAGKIDGWTTPAPSGGPARPENGFDAMRVYRVHVPRAAFLSVALTIEGTGRPEDRSDVDLELRDGRAELLTSSRGQGPEEHLGHAVEAGWYMVYVRDGGSGNRASFTLRITME